MFLRFSYTAFIGILLAAFIGVGIATFYAGPKPPEYPSPVKVARVNQEPTEEEIKQQEETNQQFKLFSEKSKEYSRNVSIIAVIFALVVLVASLTLAGNIYVISDGLLLGGILTLIYSIVRGFGTEDNMYRFIVISVGLAVSLALGYLKMVRHKSD